MHVGDGCNDVMHRATVAMDAARNTRMVVRTSPLNRINICFCFVINGCNIVYICYYGCISQVRDS